MALWHCHSNPTSHSYLQCGTQPCISSTPSSCSVAAPPLVLSMPNHPHLFQQNKPFFTYRPAQALAHISGCFFTNHQYSKSRISVVMENQEERDSSQQLKLSSATASPFRIFVSTGDVMGDIHGANLIREIFKQAESSQQIVEVYALGGKRMKDAGATLIGDNTGLSSIGLLEAIPLVVPSLLIQSAVRRFLQDHPPDVLVLLDYPGANIPFGKHVKQKFGCSVIYYIPPNEWLWNKSRSKSIVTMTDTILAVYPGEAEYYTSIGGNVELVGHPLVEAVKSITREDARSTLGIPTEDLVVALLPASRSQELWHVWPVMASAAGKLLDLLKTERGSSKVHFVIPAVLSDQKYLIRKGCEDNGISENAIIWNGNSHSVMAAADVAITKSGSANLELALYNVPQVVVYKVDAATAWIAREVFKFSVKHISLVNLILNSPVVPEFIQEEADVDKIVRATWELLPNVENAGKRRNVLDGYEKLRALLGKPGAVSRAAKRILARSRLR